MNRRNDGESTTRRGFDRFSHIESWIETLRIICDTMRSSILLCRAEVCMCGVAVVGDAHHQPPASIYISKNCGWLWLFTSLHACDDGLYIFIIHTFLLLYTFSYMHCSSSQSMYWTKLIIKVFAFVCRKKKVLIWFYYTLVRYFIIQQAKKPMGEQCYMNAVFDANASIIIRRS